MRCLVERVEELEKLSYEEEDEEGAMDEVEIQPGWLARFTGLIVTSDLTNVFAGARRRYRLKRRLRRILKRKILWRKIL